MLKMNLNIQMYAGGNGGGDWSYGVTKSAIEAAYTSFSTKLDMTIDTIKNITAVEAALKAGWSGVDCEKYIEKFKTHSNNICDEIEQYKLDVGKEKDSLIQQWADFQSSLIS